MTKYGGYDYKFVDPLNDSYNCVMCHLPSRDPYMTGECCRGQILCKSCLDQAKDVSDHDGCPVCRKMEFSTCCNYHLDREIKCLRIYCINSEEGCEWKGELSGIDNHLEHKDGCQFAKVGCINKCQEMIE